MVVVVREEIKLDDDEVDDEDEEEGVGDRGEEKEEVPNTDGPGDDSRELLLLELEPKRISRDCTTPSRLVLRKGVGWVLQ